MPPPSLSQNREEQQFPDGQAIEEGGKFTTGNTDYGETDFVKEYLLRIQPKRPISLSGTGTS